MGPARFEAAPKQKKPQIVRFVRGREVSLGCGTLVIIALIVLFCSGLGNREVQKEVSQLWASVNKLRRKVEEQTQEIRVLQAKIHNMQRPRAADSKDK